MIHLSALIATLLLIVSPVCAELPLTVEDIFTQQGKGELAVSAAYANQQQELDVFGVVTNEDALSLGLGWRYGAWRNTEVSVSSSFAWADVRGFSGNDRYSYVERRGEQITVSLSHRISDDAETPALLVFGQIVAAERIPSFDSGVVYGKRGGIGAVTYRVIDPILLSVAVTVNYGGELPLNRVDVEAGYSLLVEPRMSFFVNTRIALAGGLSWQWSDKFKVNGESVGINETATAGLFGLQYRLNNDASIQFEGRFAASGNGGSRLAIEFLYRL